MQILHGPCFIKFCGLTGASNLKKYELLEHTADLRVKIYGKDLKDLFKNSASCLFSLITKARGSKQKKIEIIFEAESLQELYINWLNELISIFYTYKFLPADFEISIEETESRKILKANISGSGFNPYNNKKMLTEIKAATFHDFVIKKEKNRFSAEVIFDV
jgi:SHS2 domain-containing protein